jgi:hypothetical protein
MNAPFGELVPAGPARLAAAPVVETGPRACLLVWLPWQMQRSLRAQAEAAGISPSCIVEKAVRGYYGSVIQEG